MKNLEGSFHHNYALYQNSLAASIIFNYAHAHKVDKMVDVATSSERKRKTHSVL